MPKSPNRPRDDFDGQLQQGPIDYADKSSDEQLGDAPSDEEASDRQSPS